MKDTRVDEQQLEALSKLVTEKELELTRRDEIISSLRQDLTDLELTSDRNATEAKQQAHLVERKQQQLLAHQ